jgi:ankyrin repeat protein
MTENNKNFSVKIDNEKDKEKSNEKNISTYSNSNKISNDVLKGFLKEGEDINQKNEIGWTPLYRSIIADDAIATELLLEKGANPDIQCSVRKFYIFYLSF